MADPPAAANRGLTGRGEVVPASSGRHVAVGRGYIGQGNEDEALEHLDAALHYWRDSDESFRMRIDAEALMARIVN